MFSFLKKGTKAKKVSETPPKITADLLQESFASPAAPVVSNEPVKPVDTATDSFLADILTSIENISLETSINREDAVLGTCHFTNHQHYSTTLWSRKIQLQQQKLSRLEHLEVAKQSHAKVCLQTNECPVEAGQRQNRLKLVVVQYTIREATKAHRIF
jgi:hypothetical protein